MMVRRHRHGLGLLLGAARVSGGAVRGQLAGGAWAGLESGVGSTTRVGLGLGLGLGIGLGLS